MKTNDCYKPLLTPPLAAARGRLEEVAAMLHEALRKYPADSPVYSNAHQLTEIAIRYLRTTDRMIGYAQLSLPPRTDTTATKR